MDSSRYLESLAADFALFRAAARADGTGGLAAPVPTCPGWTMADLVRHVGEVYLHKTLALRLGDFPGEQDWPSDLEALPPLELLDRTYAGLTAELTSRAPDSPAPSWYRPEPTVAFWMRRMAQETLIHRLDAELAARAAAGHPVSPVADDLAADGVDEVLIRFLGYGSTVWPDQFAVLRGPRLEATGGDDTVVVEAGPATWTVRPGPDRVEVQTGTGGAVHAVVAGDPVPLLRWLWGRGAEEQVSVSGDPAWVDYLRRLLVATTQ